MSEEVIDHFHPNQQREVPVPTVKCEVCGVVVPENESHSYRIVATHNGVGMPALACGCNQHFGCSPEHAESVFLRCWNEHIKLGIEALKSVMQPPAPTEDEFGEDLITPEVIAARRQDEHAGWGPAPDQSPK